MMFIHEGGTTNNDIYGNPFADDNISITKYLCFRIYLITNDEPYNPYTSHRLHFSYFSKLYIRRMLI